MTEVKRYDPNELPLWARDCPAIVRRCETDLGFRCNVYSAQTAQYRKFLTREAERLEAMRSIPGAYKERMR